MIFAPFPEGREQPLFAGGGEDAFVPASGRANSSGRSCKSCLIKSGAAGYGAEAADHGASPQDGAGRDRSLTGWAILECK